MARNPGDTFKKGGKNYKVSSTGKPFLVKKGKKAQQQRDMNARLDQPIASFQGPQGVVASPLTERDLAHEAGAATNVQFGPQQSALAQQLSDAVSQRGGVQHWYDDYRQKLQGYQQQAQAYNQGAMEAAARLPGLVQGLGQQQQQAVQGQQAQMPQGTAQVAPGPDPNAANAIGQAMAGNWAAFLQNQGTQSNLGAANLANVVAPQQQAVALQNANTNVNKVKTAQTDLASREGAYNQQYRANKRDSENRNLLAEATLGVNSANDAAKLKLAQTVAGNTKSNNATKNAQNATRIRDARTKENHRHAEAMGKATTDSAKLAETKRHNAAMESISKGKTGKALKPATGPGSLPPATEDKKVTQINQIYSFVQSKPKWTSGPNKGKPMTPEEIIHHYQAGGTDVNVLRVVNSLISNNGKIGPGGIKAAHQIGIHVNGRWGSAPAPGNPNIPAGKI